MEKIRRTIAKIPIWFWEQMVLCAFVLPATVLQLLHLAHAHEVSLRTVAPVLLTNLGTIGMQKLRSMADRQQDEDLAAGVVPVRIDCYKDKARLTLWLQAFGLFSSIVLAPTLLHMPIAIFVAVYAPIWRPYYRRHLRRR